MCLACLSHSQEYIKTGGQSQLACYDFLYEADVKLQDDQWWMVLGQRSHSVVTTRTALAFVFSG